MSASEISTVKRHILMVTFPSFGHIIPLLELAKKIGRFHDVTFAISAGKVPELVKRELLLQSDPVKVFGIEDGVKDDFDDRSDPSAVPRIFAGVLSSVEKLLSNMANNSHESAIKQSVDVVIVNTFLAATAAVCATHGLPYYVFHSSNALILRVILAYGDDPLTVPDEESDPFMRLAEDGKPAVIGETRKKMILPLRNSLHLANGHIINTLRDIEVESVREIERHPIMAGKAVYCVGPLASEEKSVESDSQLELKRKVTAWLDRQKPNSVVYVSFGTVVTPSPEQLKVIGQALLSTGQPVIWAIRDKQLPTLPEEILAEIPGQFENPESKFLVINWAPQKDVLKHDSMAVFLTHCGWNSTLEAFSSGVPVVAWPLLADQLVNGEWAEELGAGVVIPNTGGKGNVIPADEISKVVKKVGGWASGSGAKSIYAQAAKKWASKLSTAWSPGGSSYSEFSRLVHQF